MSNRDLFRSLALRAPEFTTANAAGGKAYQLDNAEALAKMAFTGTFSNTFYATAGEQLDEVIKLASTLQSEAIAKIAVAARKQGYMKDSPALLVAVLAARKNDDDAMQWFGWAFEHAIDNGRMLRNFCQIVRSGVTGRRSFGSYVKRIIQWRLETWDADYIFRQSVGNSPSMADIIKMVHPKDKPELYGYLLGKRESPEGTLARQWEAFKLFPTWEEGHPIPDVPMQLIAGMEVDADTKQQIWRELTKNGKYQFTRMNLNNFQKYGVFEHGAVPQYIIDRLKDPDLISKARQFPYQLMTSYFQTYGKVPKTISNALIQAIDHSLSNIPEIQGSIQVFVDVSGSMASPITGNRYGGHSSIVKCRDVAALVGAAFHVKTGAEVFCVDTDLYHASQLFDSGVMATAAQLSRFGGGGTRLELCGKAFNSPRWGRPDLVVVVSDNESWADRGQWGGFYGQPRSSGGLMTQWAEYKRKNKHAKLVLLDLTPSSNSQVQTRDDVLNVGGFSDKVFDVIAAFARSDGSSDFWMNQVEADVGHLE